MNQKKKKYIESKAFVTSAKMRNVRCKKTKKQIKNLGQNHLGNSNSIMKNGCMFLTSGYLFRNTTYIFIEMPSRKNFLFFRVWLVFIREEPS